MSALAIFSFENSQVRTLGTPENPLFVAIDIAVALGYANPKSAPAKIVDAEDLSKQEIETNGGRQTVNCVNESGLYALIFGSKLESAKRFKRWVTSEVLPAIRKQGRYECPLATITPAQQLALREAVARRAQVVSAHYQTIYRALYARFQVPRYTEILAKDFDAALEFVRTVDLRVPTPSSPSDDRSLPRFVDGVCPHCGLRPVPKGAVVLLPKDCLEILTFIYYVRHLFADCLNRFYQVLRAARSPDAERFWEALNSPSYITVEHLLKSHGYHIDSLGVTYSEEPKTI